ncbi:hypothetical protein NE865_15764 [Phthorimaea operculella]|nr:hypothetical protein NE865_15764 [Phthorimaea operculella]
MSTTSSNSTSGRGGKAKKGVIAPQVKGKPPASKPLLHSNLSPTQKGKLPANKAQSHTDLHLAHKKKPGGGKTVPEGTVPPKTVSLDPALAAENVVVHSQGTSKPKNDQDTNNDRTDVPALVDSREDIEKELGDLQIELPATSCPTDMTTSTPLPKNINITRVEETISLEAQQNTNEEEPNTLPTSTHKNEEDSASKSGLSPKAQEIMAKYTDEVMSKYLKHDFPLRIKTQIKEAKAAEAAGATPETSDEEGFQADDTANSNSGAGYESDYSTRTVAGNRMILSEFSRNSNRILLETKAKLEGSGNLRKDIREATVSALHTQHEMILRLADSRALHIIESQKVKQERAINTKRLVQSHSSALQKNLNNFTELKSEISSLRKEQGEIRDIISRDVCDFLSSLKTTIKSEIASISASVADLKAAAAQLVQTCTAPVVRMEGAPQDKITTDLQNIYRHIGGLEKTLEERLSITQVQEAPSLDSEGIREALRDALASSKNTPELDLTPVISLGLKNISLITDLDKKLPSVVQQEVANAAKPQKASIDKLRDEVNSLKDTMAEVNGPTRTALEELRKEVNTNVKSKPGQFKEEILKALYEYHDTKIEEYQAKGVNNEISPKDLQYHQSPPEKLIILDDASARETATKRMDTHRSYVDAVVKPRYNIVIESVDPRHTSSDVVQNIKQQVDVVQLGVGVNSIRKMRHQKVLIGCDTEKDRNTLSEAIKNAGDKLTVTQPKVKNPLLRLVGVTQDLSDKRIEEAILRQNEKLIREVDQDRRTAKVTRRVKGRNKNTANIIVELSPELWKALKDQKLRIGYQIIHALDQSPVLQCYRCLGFGHRALECQRKEMICGYCAEEHDTRQCQNRDRDP